MVFIWSVVPNCNGCGKVEIVEGIAPNHGAFANPFKRVEVDPVNCCSTNNIANTNRVVVTGLSPNTTYSFRVGGVNNNWSAIDTFTTRASYVPYHVVMNIYDDPATKMAFNWLVGGTYVTSGKVEIVEGEAPDHSAFANPSKKTALGTYTHHSSGTPYTGYTEIKAVAEGLSPNTTYSFRVGGANVIWSDIGTFTTAKDKDNKDPFSFIYITDKQINFNNSIASFKTKSDAVAAKHPNAKFWLNCGDLMEWGGDIFEWNQLFASKQAMFYHYPFAPTAGNHEIRYGGDPKNFSRHFNLEGFGTDLDRSTYTYTYGDAQFFSINSELYDNANYINALSNWMRDSINAHPDITWRIVYYHKNIYTGHASIPNTSDCKSWFDAMTPLFDELNIDIALQGHSHIYEVIGPVRGTLTPNSKPNIVPGSVSNVQTVPEDLYYKNLTGKLGGIFNVGEGTLYFTNGSFGNRQYLFYPLQLNSMPGSQFQDIKHYKDLFTGRMGQIGTATYSHVSVSTENIVIRTDTIDSNGNSQLFDEITIVKGCKDQVANVTYATNTTIKSCGADISVANVTVTNNARLTLAVGAGGGVIYTGDLNLDPGSELEIIYW